jgi:hypothetical protein
MIIRDRNANDLKPNVRRFSFMELVWVAKNEIRVKWVRMRTSVIADNTLWFSIRISRGWISEANVNKSISC